MACSGHSSGELKHGTLARVDQDSKLILFLTKDENFEKSMTAASQIVARKGNPIIVCEKDNVEAKEFVAKGGHHCIEVPHAVPAVQAILNIIPMQLLAYHMAKLKGCNVDKPRNLAKSVTVL